MPSFVLGIVVGIIFFVGLTKKPGQRKVTHGLRKEMKPRLHCS